MFIKKMYNIIFITYVLGADPTYSSHYGEDSALNLATTTNLDVRYDRRIKRIIYWGNT